MSNEPKRYEGRQADVTYDAARCIHAAECVHGLPRVFDTQRRPWIEPDAADAQALAEVVSRCPTGALAIRRKDGGEVPMPATNVIRVSHAGPLYGQGRLRLLAADKTVITEDTRVALCRCGASSNKPFCDDAHRAEGFSDPGRIAAPPPTPAEPATGLVEITTARNGPLLIVGSVDVEGTAGRVCFREGRGALCRCGHSQNKPFCDGTHKRVGFEAP